MKPRRTLPTLLTALTLVSLSAAAGLAAQTGTAADQARADALLAALDRNEISSGSRLAGSLTITDRYGTKTSGFEVHTLGTEKTLLVFTSGEEKGQKILRLKDTIYVAYPEADKPVKLQGAALRDQVAGSDFSFEDMNGEPGYASRYQPRLAGSETIEGVACTILELQARRPGLAYPLIKLWVDDRDGSLRKAEQYSQNRRLLKVQLVTETRLVKGKTVPVSIVMTDQLKANSRTELKLDTIEIDIRPADRLFSLEELTW